MTVFSVLKYRLPNLRNPVELHDLPEAIVLAWWNRIWLEMKAQGVALDMQPTTTKEVIATLYGSWAEPNCDEEFDHLHQILKEEIAKYDET